VLSQQYDITRFQVGLDRGISYTSGFVFQTFTFGYFDTTNMASYAGLFTDHLAMLLPGIGILAKSMMDMNCTGYLWQFLVQGQTAVQ
jgi:hypothetical protein